MTSPPPSPVPPRNSKSVTVAATAAVAPGVRLLSELCDMLSSTAPPSDELLSTWRVTSDALLDSPLPESNGSSQNTSLDLSSSLVLPVNREDALAIVTQLVESLRATQTLASAAYVFDCAKNYVGALDYYEKCTVQLSGVLPTFAATSKVAMQLNDLVRQYTLRHSQMEEMNLLLNRSTSVLQAVSVGDEVIEGVESSIPIEHSNVGGQQMLDGLGSGGVVHTTPMSGVRNRSSSLLSSSVGNTVSSSSSTSTGGLGTTWVGTPRVADLDFLSADPVGTFEEPPLEDISMTFWNLRCIRQTMQTGGYLTPALYIPRAMWLQTDTKMVGLPNRLTGFEHISRLAGEKLQSLYMETDEFSLGLVATALEKFADEALTLQTQLSKAFPFIKENSMMGDAGVSQSDIPIPNGNSSVSSAPVPSSTLDKLSSSPSLASSWGSRISGGKSLTSFMSSWGKNMKRYAEIGMQKISAALPSKLSPEDVQEYISKASQMCESTQLLDVWFKFLVATKEGRPVGEFKVQRMLLVACNTERETITEDERQSLIEMDCKGELFPTKGMDSLTPASLELIEVCLGHLQTISNMLRDTFCELLIRDVEALSERYLIKARKRFVRMQWDQDNNYNSD